MEYFAEIRKIEVRICATTWMKLANTVLRERKPISKDPILCVPCV